MCYYDVNQEQVKKQETLKFEIALDGNQKMEFQCDRFVLDDRDGLKVQVNVHIRDKHAGFRLTVRNAVMHNLAKNQTPEALLDFLMVNHLLLTDDQMDDYLMDQLMVGSYNRTKALGKYTFQGEEIVLVVPSRKEYEKMIHHRVYSMDHELLNYPFVLEVPGQGVQF